MAVRGTLTCHHMIIKTASYVELALSEDNTRPCVGCRFSFCAGLL